MPSFKYLLSIVFVLFASTALAAKPDKTLVCHVGSELGSSGETYQENPDCTIPDGWEGDYICPDAGKVDLISVSPKAKHIGNPSHSFEDDTGYLWEDYAPEDGVGDDPADFEQGDVVGIDKGCELPEQNLTCPCWSGFTETALVARIESQPAGYNFVCEDNQGPFSDDARIIKSDYGISNTWISLITIAGPLNSCDSYSSDGGGYVTIDLDADTAGQCYRELSAVLSQITGCP